MILGLVVFGIVLAGFLFVSGSDVDVQGGDALVTAAPGECILLDGSDSFIDDVSTVDCDEPHDAEVFHQFDISGSFPGDDAVATIAETACLSEFAAYVGIDYYESEYWLDWLAPTEGGWEAGDQEVVCLLVSGDGSSLEGSAFGSGR